MISASQSNKIIEERDKRPFADIQDLMERVKLGKDALKKLKSKIIVL